jgi:hypothetical protein
MPGLDGEIGKYLRVVDLLPGLLHNFDLRPAYRKTNSEQFGCRWDKLSISQIALTAGRDSCS